MLKIIINHFFKLFFNKNKVNNQSVFISVATIKHDNVITMLSG